MSQPLIQQYQNRLAFLKKVLGSRRESVLHKAYGDSHNLAFIPKRGIYPLIQGKVSGLFMCTMIASEHTQEIMHTMKVTKR
jgi:hypothetical protein